MSVYVDEGLLLGGMLDLQMYSSDVIHSMDWIPKLAELRVYTKHFMQVLNTTRISVMPIMQR